MVWMIEAKWNGEVSRCRAMDLGLEIKLIHNETDVWGFVEAPDQEAALDALTAYMVEHGSEKRTK